MSDSTSVATDRSSVPLGSIIATCSAITFGVLTTLGRLAYDGGSNPLTVVLLRLVTFIVIVGALLLLLRRPGRLPRRALLGTLWMAVTLAMVSLGYLGSVAFIPVSLAALILYSFPLLVGMIAAAAGRERMTIAKAAALLTAFIGLGLALGLGIESLDWRGVACAMVAALGMALTVTFGGEVMRAEDTLVMNFYTNLWLLIGLAAYMAAAGGFLLPSTGLGVIGAAGVCVTYVGGFVSLFVSLRMISPVRLAALFNIEPLVTVVAAWLLLGEVLGVMQLIGAALVLGSIVAITLASSRIRE